MIASSNNNLLQQTESIKHDIEKEVLQNNNNGFSKEELLTIELDKAIKNNTDINLQFDFLKKKYSGLQEELNNALEAQSKLEKQFYKLEAELDLSKEAELENNKKIREMEVKLTKTTRR
ncbi:hypothetical protein K502DRAFT_18401 [Neoconidiobolus thromboides FSU 785]|nr:hypothetical protein K502DRAFT_18401 [Neoconidiobolus thromboides FSU 785]